MADAATAPVPPAQPQGGAGSTATRMTPREVSLAMTALIASLFVAMLSNTVVLTAMPRIAAELHATQAHYTWIITASMLTMAVCMPIWGRISDILNQKLLMQLAVGGYVSASLVASLAQAPWVIILCRIMIGICASGIIVMLQTISAAIMSPRERARWIGYRAAAMSVATVGAPSLGGILTETLGWRACFVVGVPFAVAAIVLLQRTLRLPPAQWERRPIDWLGALLLAGGIIALMLWISVAGPNQGYASREGLICLGAGIVLLAVATIVEQRVAAPVVPLGLFRQKEVFLCVLASAASGIGFFCSAVYLAQYLQLGRGLEPSAAGLMALPEAAGGLLGAMATSRIISRHGHYRATLIFGSFVLLAGFVALATIGSATPFLWVAIFVATVGCGLGVTGETLTIVVQNAVARRDVGAATALVSFFRMLGGVAGVAVLGAILGAHVRARLAAEHVAGLKPNSVPELSRLAAPLRLHVEHAYASGVALLYLACVPVMIVMIISMVLMPAGALSDEDPLA